MQETNQEDKKTEKNVTWNGSAMVAELTAACGGGRALFQAAMLLLQFFFFFLLPSAISAPPPRLFCSSMFMVWRWRYHLRQRGIMEVALRWRINPGGDPSSSSPLCLSAFLFFSSLFSSFLLLYLSSSSPLLFFILQTIFLPASLKYHRLSFKISVVLHPKTLLTPSACPFVFFLKPKSFPLLFSIFYPLSLPSVLSSPLSVFCSFSSPFPPKPPHCNIFLWSFPVFSSLLFPLFFFSFFFILCIAALSFFYSPAPPLILLRLSSSIYKQEERERPPCPVSSRCRAAPGWWGQRERKIVALQGNIIAFSSSVLCACRGRRRLTAPFKTAPFASFSLSLFLTVHETAPFCPKRAVSFKRKWRQNASISNQSFNLRAFFDFGPWFRISSIKSLIGHQTSIFMQLSPWFDQINSQKL